MPTTVPTRVPVPLAVRTHCPYCAFQCGVLMPESPTGPGWSVGGDPHFPVNNGELCVKGWTSAGLLIHPGRLTAPRVRSHGELVPASWDVALDVVADGVAAVKNRHGPDAVGVFGSGALTNESAYLLGKFARLAVGTRHIDYNGRFCMASGAAGGNKAFGLDRGLPFPVADIAHAGAVLLVGANAADTLPPVMQWFTKQKANGGKLIVADPRRTATARAADLHLPVTPGADLGLANGLLYVALEEGLTDPAFIAARTTGFDAVRRAVLAYHPARVERITGVTEAAIRQTVRWLAAADRAMVLTGRGPEQQSKGVDTVLAFINLALALGKVGRPGSGYGCLTGQGNGQGGREHGQKADQLPGYRLIEDAADRAAVAAVWGVPAESLPGKGHSAYELLDALGPAGGVRALLVLGSNVAVAAPNATHVGDKLDALELLAVCDGFLNETAARAHVVLPVCQWAEDGGTMTNLEGRVIRRRAVARAPAGVRTDRDVLRGLADRLGCGHQFAFHSAAEVFAEFRRATAGGKADYAGITYDRIDAEDGVFWPCPDESHPGTPRPFLDRFAHPDGRAKFHPVEHRPAGEEPCAAYPLYLTTGRVKEHYNSGAQTRRVAALAKARPYPTAEIHPHLAARLGAEAGSLLTVETRRGRAEFAAAVTHDIRPDTLFVAFHWGGAQAVNRLTSPALDPTSRMPEFKVAAARVAAVRPGPEAAT